MQTAQLEQILTVLQTARLEQDIVVGVFEALKTSLKQRGWRKF